MYYTSGNYEAFARPRKPAGIDNKTAWFVGAGPASLAGREGTTRPLAARFGEPRGPAGIPAGELHGPDVVDGRRDPVADRAVPDDRLRARQAQARLEQTAHHLAGELLLHQPG